MQEKIILAQNKSQYNLLEPINFENPSDESNAQKSIQVSGGSEGFNKYINDIFVIVLVIVVLISIFMLMYGGALYLTKDIGSKVASGKKIILGVFSGITFIFLIWVIFYTVNPKFLEKGIVMNIISATNLNNNDNNSTDTNNNNNNKTDNNKSDNNENYNDSADDDSSGNIQTKTSGCDGEIVKIDDKTGHMICSTIKDNFLKMVEAAKADGINIIVRSSFRPKEKQVSLRKQNCGTSEYDIYQKPSRQCSPPTAIPGRSNHEKGLALDFNIPRHQCNNICQWLQKNGSKYGFYNNYGAINEYWHWSVNGR